MKKFFITIIFGLMILSHAQAAIIYKPTVAVLTFGTSENFTRYFESYNAGVHFSDCLIEFLVNSRAFDVIEAEYLMKRKAINIPRHISSGSAARIGRKLGVDYVIYGKVKSYVRHISDSQIYSERFKVKMSIDAAMIDVETGDVVSKVNYDGEFKFSQTDVPRHSVRSLLRKVAEGFVDSVVENFSADRDGGYYLDDYVIENYGVEDNPVGEEW